MGNPFSKEEKNKGASLVIAMLFFLIAVTIGGIILTAATAGAGRLSTIQSQEQDYFTVSSAARLFSEGMNGTVYVSIQTNQETPVEATQSCQTPLLGNDVKALAYERLIQGNEPQPHSFTVQAENLEIVHGSLTISAQGNLHASFWLEDAGGHKRSGIRLEFPVILTTQEQTNSRIEGGKTIVSTIWTRTYTWQNGTFTSEGGGL